MIKNKRTSKTHTFDEASFLQDLFSLEGDDFIIRAYQLILGRQADLSGLNFYKTLIKRNNSKAQVALDLLESLEGRANPYWSEMRSFVRKQRRREFWDIKTLIRHWHSDSRITPELESVDSIPSRFEVPIESNKLGRDFGEFKKSFSPRALTLARILAAAERE